jgi:hypothetical protein
MSLRGTHVPLLGVCIGLVGAAVVLAMSGGRQTIATNGPMMSECDGRIRSIAIQYVHDARFVAPIYRQFLNALPGDVAVYAVCPDQASFDELASQLGAGAGRLTPVITGHAMTAWSRDRWIALAPGQGESVPTLVAPAAENGVEIWPQRLGDQRIAQDLAESLRLRAMRSGLYFDGGDLLADSRSLFVAPGAIYRNLQHTCADEKELADILRRQFGRSPIFLDKAPDHHVGMYMMAAGENRVVVGDPLLAKPLLAKTELPGGADFSAETQAKFDFVARAAREAGYAVTQIPCVPSHDGKTYLTFVNGIIDRRDGGRTIYMPVYEGEDRLNEAAAKVWRGLGYRVERIDVTSSFRFFGTLHCLVNVISRG